MWLSFFKNTDKVHCMPTLFWAFSALKAGKDSFSCYWPWPFYTAQPWSSDGFIYFVRSQGDVEACSFFIVLILKERFFYRTAVPYQITRKGLQSKRMYRRDPLARKEAKSWKNLLIREAFTQTQTRVSLSERLQNVKNAFALIRDAVVIPDKTYILIDDVFTTGSTLNACPAVH